jgi:hypothetical protein
LDFGQIIRREKAQIAKRQKAGGFLPQPAWVAQGLSGGLLGTGEQQAFGQPYAQFTFTNCEMPQQAVSYSAQNVLARANTGQ